MYMRFTNIFLYYFYYTCFLGITFKNRTLHVFDFKLCKNSKKIEYTNKTTNKHG